MRILVTGGSGRLGVTLLEHLGGEVLAPRSSELDITDPAAVRRVIDESRPDAVVNCAAFTDVAAAEQKADEAFRVNVEGAYHLFRACEGRATRLVQISTDHVFDGSRGMYREDDRPNPIGVYAVTKYLAEQTVLLSERNAVLRTSFLKDFALPAAFDDKFFSGDVVSAIAADLALAIESGVTGLWHVAGRRASIYDVARKLKPDVRRMKLADNPINRVGLPYLKDVSLDTSKWTRRKAEITARGIRV